MWETVAGAREATSGPSPSARGKYFFSLRKCFSNRFQLASAMSTLIDPVMSVKAMAPGMCDPATVDVAILANADWIVDALFGSGQRGPVRPPFDRVVEAINAAGRRVLAVDIPTGLDADTGLPQGATIRATHTATVIAAKKGFALRARRSPTWSSWTSCCLA